jgi:hypothetical protein
MEASIFLNDECSKIITNIIVCEPSRWRLSMSDENDVLMDAAIHHIDPNEVRHFDHGYAVTSQSSQGLTAERVLIKSSAVEMRNTNDIPQKYGTWRRQATDARQMQ